MPDRSSRSQRGGGFISISGLTPPELPDYQSDLNKQLSFLKSMDAYMNPGGSGGGTIRNANGLTPYQQWQVDEAKRKAAEKAAAEEAKKNVVVGTNPKTGQPMVFRNETGYKLSDKRMQEIYAGMLEDELRKDIANDEELNRIKGIAFGPRPISIDYRKQLERQYRDRTKALASIYKIDDRAAFDAAFGEQSKSIRKEQQRALNEDSFLSVLGSGVAQGWSDFINAMRMPLQNETERLETARQSLKERQERIAASPTLREREMEEQEAAEQGKDISYWQATDKNRASNLAASVAGTLTSFAVPVGLSMAAAPFTGGASLTGLSSLATAVPIAATGVLGAGMNQLGQAQRAAQDPNLTEEQKTDVLSMSDPGFAGTTLLGGVAGALMPGGVGSGIVRGAGNVAFRRAAAAGPINPATVPGLTGRALRAGARATERANAPRSLGTLARDIAVNSGENAAIMGANTIGANIAYNASTDQPLTQGATQGALGAIGEGAIIGVPFGGARTLRRPRVARAEAPAAGESAAETPSNTGETPAPQTPAAQPQNTTWTQRLRADSGFNAWSNALVQATRMNDGAKVDELVAEYLAGGGRLEDLELIRDSYAKGSNKKLVSDAEFAKTHDGLGHVRVSDEFGWTEQNDKGINAAIARWKEAENNDALSNKIAGAFTGEPESSRVAGIMAELESARAGSTAGQGNNANSSMENNSNANAEVPADRTFVQNSADNSGVEGERLGGKPTPNVRQIKGDTKNVGQETAEQQEGVVPADLGSSRSRSGKTGDGPGSKLNPTVGRDGGPSDAAANSGGEQSPSQPVATRGTPKSGKNKGTPDTLVVDGATFVRHPGVKSWKLRTTKGKKTSDLVINTKSVTPGMPDSIKAIKPSKRNEELTRLFDENVDNAKSTSSRGGVRESRALREPRQTKKVYKLMRVKRDAQGNVQRDENGNPILYPLFVGNDEPIKIGTTYSADSPDFSFLRSLPDGDWRVNMTTGEAQSWADYATANNIKRRSPNKDDINAATATGSRWMRIRPAKNVQKNSGDKRTYHNIGLSGSGEVATFALRPGWHTTDVPTARQIKIRNDDHVWVEGSIAAERDYTSVDANGNYRDMISMPRDNNTEGFYRYYTSANAKQGNGDWYISSTFRPERIISDAEARSVVDAANARWNGSRRAEYDNPRASGREFTGFDTVRESRGLPSSKDTNIFLEQSDKVLFRENISREDAVANNKLPENLRRLFTTAEEKQMLAGLDSSKIMSAKYVANMERVLQTILNKLPGLKTKKALVYLAYDETRAGYDKANRTIQMNLYHNAGSAETILGNMNHEIGHGTQAEIGNPSTNEFINAEAYRNASPAVRADIEEAYNSSDSLRRDPRDRTEAFYGEEIYSELLAGEAPFTDAESARAGILELYNSAASNKRTQLYSQAMSFFAQHADQGTYNEFAKAAINSSKEHVDMFTRDSLDDIQNPLARQMVQDYRNVAHEANVPLNTETLGYYLDAVLDHDTSLNVWKRQSMPC